MPISSQKQKCRTDENSSSSSSSSFVVVSNTDLLNQILMCLPVKSLLVFKSVSKQWLYIISDQSFIRHHYHQNNSLSSSIHGLILCKKRVSVEAYDFVFLDRRKITNNNVPFQSLPFSNDARVIDIEQSCNGLLCCSFKYFFTYYIYNPSTKRYKILPPFQSDKNVFVFRRMSLAFDPLKSPHYEVICIFPIRGLEEYGIQIYSSETNSWRFSRASFPALMYSSSLEESAVFWNGSLHWIDLSKKFAVYFNIVKDMVQEMPFPLVPHEYLGGLRPKYFGECRGHLHIISCDPSTTCIDILEMDTDYTGWNMKYRVNLEGLIITYPGIGRGKFNFSVLLVEDEEVSPKLVLHIPSNRVIISYDIKGFSFKKIHDLAPRLHSPNSLFGLNAYQYIETLACV